MGTEEDWNGGFEEGIREAVNKEYATPKAIIPSRQDHDAIN
jgi:hypothetical protein